MAGLRPPSRGPLHSSTNVAIVGIGASAGGLDACKTLLDALPADSGMAFIVVQHLDPTHESMLADLLAGHTHMPVQETTDGTPVERNHVYVIPPGRYLSVSGGVMRIAQAEATTQPPHDGSPHMGGARLPFDSLLRSLAGECGDRAICVVLSGTGADGSSGLKAIKESCGLVIVQEPAEATYDGMPRNAIMTGAVDLILPVANIPEAIVRYGRRMTVSRATARGTPPEATPDWVSRIIDLLRTNAGHDFRLYKAGTLRRRIERRMAMAAISSDNPDGYLSILRDDPHELDRLAKDLLINVTGFFRDPNVFGALADRVIPDMVRQHPPDRPLRIWVAGCSTGEETYSLTMLFQEAITAAGRDINVQVLASDVDADAVAKAREGLYPSTIEADVSQARLSRFFTTEGQGYRVAANLRALVVFTVQDVLADPPFSRLDLISCRNLLIYLQPEAQAQVLSLFHFALREGGLLLLGSSETTGSLDSRFEEVSKTERLYRHVSRSQPGKVWFPGATPGDGPRTLARPGQEHAPARQTGLAEMCQRLVIEAYGPAAVLINGKHECLYHLGPTDHFLSIAPGHSTHDVLAMAREGLRTKLRTAIQRARQKNERVTASVPSGQALHDGAAAHGFSISVLPVRRDGEDLFLVCFIEAPEHDSALLSGRDRPTAPGDGARLGSLKQELETTKAELQEAIRALEASSAEQTAINEEALSANEEYQSANEELLTSKEELQSLNEELTALNAQLQETLERQRTTSNDLQNVLDSTDVATLFLDPDLKIRLFTPATKSLFHLIPGDIGRPLSDLHAMTADSALLADARIVLDRHSPIEREVEAEGGAWYVRRIMPYRTHGDGDGDGDGDGGVEGVVVTFINITERKHTADALDTARRQAEQATIAKSRFLGAASHDLRQPLQALGLMGGALARKIEAGKTDEALALVARLEHISATMAGTLNALLDINQIETGTVHVEIVRFRVSDVFERLREEFAYQAQIQGLALRVIPCSLSINGDPRLLEQMIRNILSNALKYTRQGKVLLGCRRHGGLLNIEIRDTGIGIPESQHQAIFEEYLQLDNAAHERSRGLGLGLAIAKRLGDLMDYRLAVRSRPGMGSVFVIEVGRARDMTVPPLQHQPTRHQNPGRQQHAPPRSEQGAPPSPTRTILVIEDDPDVRDLLRHLLDDAGHHVATAPDGIAASKLVEQGAIRPGLILADYSLPNGLNGIQGATKIREALHRHVPVIILTGDISTVNLGEIAQYDCVQLSKPVEPRELVQTVQRLLSAPHALPAGGPPRASMPSESPPAPVIFVVDDDHDILDGLRSTFEDCGWYMEGFATCEAFLDAERSGLGACRPGRDACILIDAYIPGGMSGLDLLAWLGISGHRPPAIMITGKSDVSMAVQAMKAGAADFIEKPVRQQQLLASIKTAMERSRDSSRSVEWHETAAKSIASLTLRQRQILDLVLSGKASKNIAAELSISQRTVENHRAAIMKRTGASSLPALARLALAAESMDAEPMDAGRDRRRG